MKIFIELIPSTSSHCWRHEVDDGRRMADCAPIRFHQRPINPGDECERLLFPSQRRSISKGICMPTPSGDGNTDSHSIELGAQCGVASIADLHYKFG